MGRSWWAAGAATTLTVATVTVLVVGGGPVLRPAAIPAAHADELARFAGCGQLRHWYRDAALPEVTAYGFGYPYVYGDVIALTAARSAAFEDFEAVGAGETGTNVQEADVDEPDVAKTDGETVVLLDGAELVVVDVTGTEPTELSRLALPAGAPADELLLVGDRAVLLGSARDRLVTTVVDLADPGAPVVVHTEQSEGNLVSAREHDGTVRIVTSQDPDLPFVTPGTDYSPREARAENRRIVRAAKARDWLPARSDSGGDLAAGANGDDVTRLLACADVRRPDRASGLGTVSVTTLDPAAPDERVATGVTADGSMVYASTDRLYVATTQGGWDELAGIGRGFIAPQPAGPTEVHAFDTSGTTTSYVASGRVPGAAPDRWAFSEHDGRLRVATALGSSWSPRESQVTVLEESGGELVEVGSVAGMGEGEQIHAVRWFGDVAVLVTFRQTDPLYTIDLSDPTRPRVAGELKIPGFSDYLHPVGGGLLLGVGQDANQRGRTQGAQLSTFDLADLAAPDRVATLDLQAEQTPVQQDARAFGYLPDQRLALLPTESLGRSRETALSLVRVGADGSMVELERLSSLPGGAAGVRALPLANGRVAVVADGAVDHLMTPPVR
ncbi:MAG: beta-propeller domain-containing protein [Nocardioidaceae bacterium]|nr:beta-propeller domain-containing protein [Nocardioidaceae bacterium]